MTPTIVPPPTDRPAARAAARRFAAAHAAEAEVGFCVLDTPVGRLVAAATDRGLVRLAYEDDGGADAVLQALADRVSPRILEDRPRLDGVARELEEYFAGARTRFDVAVDWRLVGAFGRRVLDATAAIAFGQVATYREVATAAGNPAASRAAGGALGANPVPIVVPCHRVLRTGGGLGGYTGGLQRKEQLLRLEGVAL